MGYLLKSKGKTLIVLQMIPVLASIALELFGFLNYIIRGSTCIKMKLMLSPKRNPCCGHARRKP